MVILIIKHKAFTDVGPANGYPAGETAHIFDDREEAEAFFDKVRVFDQFGGAQFFHDDEDIKDHRKQSTEE